jgi:hypothetical protein
MPSVASATRRVDPNGGSAPRGKISAVDVKNQTRLCRVRSSRPQRETQLVYQVQAPAARPRSARIGHRPDLHSPPKGSARIGTRAAMLRVCCRRRHVASGNLDKLVGTVSAATSSSAAWRNSVSRRR